MTLDTKIYSIKDITKLCEDFKFIKNNRGVEYMNIPCVIDIESSSFFENGEKRAIMYAFVLGINGKCIIGRTYEDLLFLLNSVSEYYGLHSKKRIIFYVHNLSYEFQFFRKWFTWEKVFAIDPRKVVYALNDIGIELRCSYILSGYSLQQLSKTLVTYKVEKMVGDLDYSKIRHSKTPLTEKEIGYIHHDGLVPMAYIQEEIERCGNNITRIQLTKTGKVRDYCRKQCYYTTGSHKITKRNGQQKYFRYRRLMNHLKIQSVTEYHQLKRAFMGGFTHANPFYVGRKVSNVTSYDFTSSYPFVMVSEQFPMSKGELITITSKEEFERNLKLYCCLFDITLYDVESIECYEHPISSSKCFNISEITCDNGRIVNAKQITMTITEQDYFVFRKFYKWSHMKIKNFRRYKRGYLPRDFVLAILDLYGKKTTLKGVEGFENEYMVSKENVNSCYGMMVTDICQNDLIYNQIDDGENGGWECGEIDEQKQIEKYNNSKRRFLFYPWGIWVTAYARRNLFTGIFECKMDYVYSDTDSIKIRNPNTHMKYINAYNNRVINKLKNAMEYQHIPFEMVKPKTIEGDEKMLGLWDFDGNYILFKTLGAKRYMVKTQKLINYGSEENPKLIPYSLTISGVNKHYAIPYLYETYGDGIFDALCDGLKIPSDYTGKNVHTYLDFEQNGYVKDYNNIINPYHEYSSIHMEGCEYELSMAREFVDFLMEIENYMD